MSTDILTDTLHIFGEDFIQRLKWIKHYQIPFSGVHYVTKKIEVPFQFKQMVSYLNKYDDFTIKNAFRILLQEKFPNLIFKLEINNLEDLRWIMSSGDPRNKWFWIFMIMPIIPLWNCFNINKLKKNKHYTFNIFVTYSSKIASPFTSQVS